MSDLSEALAVPARPVSAREGMGPGHYALPLSVLDVRTVAARRWSEFPTDEDVEAATEVVIDRALDRLPMDFEDHIQDIVNGEYDDWFEWIARAALAAVRARETGETLE